MLLVSNVVLFIVAAWGWHLVWKRELGPEFHVVVPDVLPGMVLTKKAALNTDGLPDSLTAHVLDTAIQDPDNPELNKYVGWHPLFFALALRLRLANSSDQQAELLKYSVEARTSRGWTKLGHSALEPPYIIEWSLLGEKGEPRDIRYYNLSRHYFDEKVGDRAIYPRRSVDGWAFFTADADSNILPEVKELRFTFVDTTGRITVQNLGSPWDEDTSDWVLPKDMPPEMTAAPWTSLGVEDSRAQP